MQKQSLVSIITPTYNHERFIGQCIESVLAQTYPHWEQIIIDDGSTDRTGGIVAGYKDERIKYIRQDNVGIWKLGETYNKALQISEGEFIAVLEGDDFWPPDKLEKQLPAFDRQKVVLSWGKTVVTNNKGQTIAVSPRNFGRYRNLSKEKTVKQLLFRNFIPASTVMCRKDALLRIGGFKQVEYTPYVDYSTWLELSLLGDFFAIDEILGYWRQHEEQVSAVMRMTMAESSKYSMGFFEQMPQELRSSMGVNINELLAAYQHRIASAHVALGRTALTEGKWEQAGREFRRALSKGSFSTKIEALLGLVCARCRLDMEWAATIMHRPRLK